MSQFYHTNQALSSTAPIGRLFNYIIAIDKNRVIYRPDKYSHWYKKGISDASCIEFLLGLGFITVYPSTSKEHTVKLTQAGNSILDELKNNRTTFYSEVGNFVLKKYKGTQIYENIVDGFLKSDVFGILIQFIREYGYNYDKKKFNSDFYNFCLDYEKKVNQDQVEFIIELSSTRFKSAKSLLDLCRFVDIGYQNGRLFVFNEKNLSDLIHRRNEYLFSKRKVSSVIEEIPVEVEKDKNNGFKIKNEKNLAAKFEAEHKIDNASEIIIQSHIRAEKGSAVVALDPTIAKVKTSEQVNLAKLNEYYLNNELIYTYDVSKSKNSYMLDCLTKESGCCAICGSEFKKILTGTYFIKPDVKNKVIDTNEGLILCTSHASLMTSYLITISAKNLDLVISPLLSSDRFSELKLDLNYKIDKNLFNATRIENLKIHNKLFNQYNFTKKKKSKEKNE